MLSFQFTFMLFHTTITSDVTVDVSQTLNIQFIREIDVEDFHSFSDTNFLSDILSFNDHSWSLVDYF